MENIKLNSICVIILNYQSYLDTIKYINCLQNQDSILLHILVVDNCSPNKSFDILKKEFSNSDTVEVIKSERNGGYAYGNNFGLRYIENRKIDYILISNNDIEFEDTLLLSKMIIEYEKLDRPAFVSPMMLINYRISYFDSAWRLPTKTSEIFRSTFLLSFLGYFYLKSQFYYMENINKTPIVVDCLPGSFFMGTQDVFRNINYFDEGTFLYLEETIIGEKVKEFGLKNYLITALAYNHNASKTIDQFNSQIHKFRILLKSKIYYWEKYKKADTFFINLIKYLYKVRGFELYILKALKSNNND
jgi:GT2 family glycosyltransferase